MYDNGGGDFHRHARAALIVRPASREDLISYCGNDGKGPSIKAVCAEMDGKIIGVGGLAFKAGMVVAFTDISEEARPFKTAIHRTAVRFLKEARKKHRIIYAEMSDEPTARKWLLRLGAEEIHKGVFAWRTLAQSAQ